MYHFIKSVTEIFGMRADKVLNNAVRLKLPLKDIEELIFQYEYCTKDVFISRKQINCLCRNKGMRFISENLDLIYAKVCQTKYYDIINQAYDENEQLFRNLINYKSEVLRK